jgi:hypothetical protein
MVRIDVTAVIQMLSIIGIQHSLHAEMHKRYGKSTGVFVTRVASLSIKIKAQACCAPPGELRSTAERGVYRYGRPSSGGCWKILGITWLAFSAAPYTAGITHAPGLYRSTSFYEKKD